MYAVYLYYIYLLYNTNLTMFYALRNKTEAVDSRKNTLNMNYITVMTSFYFKFLLNYEQHFKFFLIFFKNSFWWIFKNGVKLTLSHRTKNSALLENFQN